MNWSFFNNVTYCVLHGWNKLPEPPSSDLDIVVIPKDLPILAELLSRMKEARLINLLQHESTSYYFILAMINHNEIAFLPIDAAVDYRRDGRVWFSADELLADRRKRGDFWIAAPAVEFKYLLTKKLLKLSMPFRTAMRLQELAEDLGRDAEEVSCGMLGRSWGPRVFSWIKNGDWKELEASLPALKKALKFERFKRDPLNPLRYWLPELWRRWMRWRKPTGLWVAVMGLDGSGKTTVLRAIQSDLARAFRRTEVFHFRPTKGRGGSSVSDPHALPPRHLTLSLAKLGFYIVDYIFSYVFKIRPALVRSTLVLFDRYYHDVLVDPKRYRYGGPQLFSKLIEYLVPKPDLFIFLDLPAEVAHDRKPEVPLEEARRLRRRYLELARSMPNAHVVDASKPLDEVARDVERIILDYMAERTKKRLLGMKLGPKK